MTITNNNKKLQMYKGKSSYIDERRKDSPK